ncbi:uncharacterized protein LOC128387024 [Panonychus citri]|uniref:uncharacterized protein LOC128387024 n=1 Tax=Panonychus citri TaxID=50023 RepID=UPI00230785B7|nr:uncharacterized protein LOC128387024 [Panonychus citri]
MESGTVSDSLFSWLNYVDPMVSKVPILATNPMFVFIFIIVYLLVAFHLGPLLVASSKPADLRPYMLISNALIFGASAMGIPLAMYLTSWATIPWQCPEPYIQPALLETQIYLGVAFFLIQLFTASTTIYMIVRKKETQNPGLDALRTSGIIFLVYFGARQHPRGPFLFRPICEIILATLRRAYYILLTPVQSYGSYRSLKNLINYSTLASGIINTGHIGYMFTRDCPGDVNIKLISMTTAAIEATYLTYTLVIKGKSNDKIDCKDGKDK